MSLVIVVYGGLEMTLRLLEGLPSSTGVSFEVILIDNASPDGTGERLRREARGATVVLSGTNLGYGVAANLGVRLAQGKYVGILNTDISPATAWLEPMVDLMETNPVVGAVVPAYLNEDGRIRDAGVLVDNEARVRGYGSGWWPTSPEADFWRVVDYGSAAAMLARANAFRFVGGFDPQYGLGYYEDADLCFSLRRAGWLTAYEPRAKVTHHRGGSFSEPLRRRLSEQNRPVFRDRFSDQLDGRPKLLHPPWDPHRSLILRDWWCRDRLLVLDEDGSLMPVAAQVRQASPRSLVTWLGPRTGIRVQGDEGVERLGCLRNIRRWLESRRHHYGFVLAPGSLLDKYASHLRSSQPQARLLSLGPAAATPVSVETGRFMDTLRASGWSA